MQLMNLILLVIAVFCLLGLNALALGARDLDALKRVGAGTLGGLLGDERRLLAGRLAAIDLRSDIHSSGSGSRVRSRLCPQQGYGMVYDE